MISPCDQALRVGGKGKIAEGRGSCLNGLRFWDYAKYV